MSILYEDRPVVVPTDLEAHRHEQWLIQDGKHRDRLLDGNGNYGSYVFPVEEGEDTEVSEYLASQIPGAVSFEGLLRGIALRQNGSVHWVDMAGGKAAALRQAQGILGQQINLRTTNVDLFDWPIDDDKRRLSYLNNRAKLALQDPAYAPHYVPGNIESVQLEDKADVVTCIQGIQYAHDPARAIVNSYNQLCDGGFLIVAGPFSLTTYTHQQARRQTPIEDVLDQLDEYGIPHKRANLNRYIDAPFDRLVVRKAGDTDLLLDSVVEDVRVNSIGRKAVVYSRATIQPVAA